jgi:Membrane domain of glycerophosphoryl diester phosphodiesterase
MAAVDLRPMSLGEVLDRTFSLYKQNFWLFAGIAAFPLLFVLLLELAGDALQGPTVPVAQPGSFPAGPFGGALTSGSVGMIGGMLAGGTIVVILYLFMAGATQAATIFAVSDLYLGNGATVRGSFARVGSKVLRVVGILVILFLAFVVGIFVVAIAIGIAAAVLRSPAVVFLGLLLAMVPAVYFFCRTAIAVPAAMLEDSGAGRALGRSMELTKGYAGQVFLIFLLVIIISIIASGILQVLFLGNTFTAIREHREVRTGTMVLFQLFNFIVRVLIAPIGTIACSLMYYNLRVRKEAFDVQHLMASLGTQPAPGTTPAI